MISDGYRESSVVSPENGEQDFLDWGALHKARGLVAYYVSGHGWGHLTRSLALACELLTHQFCVLLCTPVSPDAVHAQLLLLLGAYRTHAVEFPQSLRPEEQLRVRAVKLDVGCIQSDALTIDAAATLTAYREINERRQTLIRVESAMLRRLQPQLILADAVALAAAAAKAAALSDRFVFVTNFLFSAIYDQFLSEIPSLNTPQNRALVERMAMDESEAPVWVQLSPGLVPPLRSFGGRCFSAGPVSRPWKSTRAETRRRLGISLSARVLLVCFGSFDCKTLFGEQGCPLHSFLEQVDLIREPGSPWRMMLLTEYDAVSSSPRVRFVHPSAATYVPDLIQAADVVLGKLGYGISAECLAAGTPLVYVRRPLFLEEEALRRDLQGLCVELTIEELRSGCWRRAVHQALESKGSTARARFGPEHPLASIRRLGALVQQWMRGSQ
ncbi:hypothetical protein, conserved [Cyanidioschyzon merolae strain 10D]|uniref:Glycosyl transferase family 28 C-terminal domain-containing protein n=1 Tax=Cyanidioschyzon merolae (strain NIES-3377 / 10D) TaxID=280699 RepID=M1VMS1_CYAM1|nr:hypothetical protein, conserved [Cyanidioschyzon merolae strain 10D]BAM83483.1 hypothetical protein, conserved [Cyanidioschyzon merolae strain 10D]|eukprot:XP_005539519.1 hypothetical protein, conserved [Cyanidioschyzon merolae strain 10D]